MNDSYVHEQLKIGLHILPDGIDHQSVFVSVSKKNGLLKSVKTSTGASRQAFLRVSKAHNVSSMSVTHSFFLLLPQKDVHAEVAQYEWTLYELPYCPAELKKG